MLELIVLSAVCALLGLGCLGAVGWALFSSEDIGVERIFLLHVWLLLAALFFGMSAWIARQGPLRELWKKSSEAKAPEAKAAATQQKKPSREEAQKPAS